MGKSLNEIRKMARPRTGVEYVFEVTSADVRPSAQGTDVDVLHVRVRVCEGEAKGREARLYVPLTERGAGEVEDLATACAVDLDADGDAELASLLRGRRLRAVLDSDGEFLRLVNPRPAGA
jgi:hypothetical protein